MTVNRKISVVTVVKNGAGCLENTISSVLEKKQTTDIDLLVIDGGSTDGTLEIIKKYAGRIEYWISEQDNGIYDAMNKGWKAAAEDSFILFLGAGDRIISLPDMNLFGQYDVVFGSVMTGENKVFKPRLGFHLKLYNSLHHQALLVSKAFHPDPPFNTLYRLYADFDFNQRLKKNGARFICAPGFVGYARPGGVSDQQDFAESLRIILANHGFLWAILALVGYYATKILPFLKRLRPVKDVSQ